MTKADFFNNLYDNVPKEKREAFIADVMETAAKYMAEPTLTPEQLAEIKRRVDDPNPRYATDAEMRKVLGDDYPR